MDSIVDINRSERKLIKKLATIDGTNYWNYHWNADKTEHSHKLVARISEHAVKEEDAHNQRKFAYMELIAFSLHTTAIIMGLILGYVYLGSIIGAMLGFVFFLTIIRYCVFFPLKLSFLMRVKAPVAYDFKNNNSRKPYFILNNISKDQADDVATELNILREQGRVNEYMMIIKKIMNNHKDSMAVQDEKAKINKIKEERKQFNDALKYKRESNERRKTNHYLNHRSIQVINDLDIIDSIESLEEKIATYINNSDFLVLKKSFQDIERMVHQGCTVDMRAYNDCRSELYSITEKYNEIIDSGLELSVDELDEYRKLMENCTKILNRIMKNSVEYRSFDAKIANLFLEDKYSL